jgi:hypothetical protein
MGVGQRSEIAIQVKEENTVSTLFKKRYWAYGNGSMGHSKRAGPEWGTVANALVVMRLD